MQGLPDHLHYTLGVPKNFVIPEPKDVETLVVKMCIACRIGAKAFLRIVLAAVDFNHETRRVAGEINDEMIDRNLAPKVKPFRFQ